MEKSKPKIEYTGLVKFLLKYGFQLYVKSALKGLRQEDAFFQKEVVGIYQGSNQVLFYIDAYYYLDCDKQTDLGKTVRQIEGILFDAVFFNDYTSDVGTTVTVDLRDFGDVGKVIEFYKVMFDTLKCRPVS